MGDGFGGGQGGIALLQQAADDCFQGGIAGGVNRRAQALANCGLKTGDQGFGLGQGSSFGHDADVRLAGVRGKAHRGIGRNLQIGDGLVDAALADRHRAQNTRHQHGLPAQLALQVGDHGVLHQVAHLARYTGQGDDRPPFVLDDEARRRTNRVLDGDAILGQIGLAAIVVAHLCAKAREEGLDLS